MNKTCYRKIQTLLCDMEKLNSDIDIYISEKNIRDKLKIYLFQCQVQILYNNIERMYDLKGTEFNTLYMTCQENIKEINKSMS